MRANLRRQLRDVKERIGRLERRGGPVVRVAYDDTEADVMTAQAKAEHPGRELFLVRVVYE